MDPHVLRYAAFTDHGRGGNPAGVVLDAGGMSDERMLAVAAEVGYSETAFVTGSEGDGRFTLRYFSPRAEVAFCGHATVATAVALAERDGPGRLLLDTRAGEVGVLTAVQPSGTPHAPGGGLTATLTSVPTRTRPARHAPGATWTASPTSHSCSTMAPVFTIAQSPMRASVIIEAFGPTTTFLPSVAVGETKAVGWTAPASAKPSDSSRAA